jgi:hypothetical protein
MSRTGVPDRHRDRAARQIRMVCHRFDTPHGLPAGTMTWDLVLDLDVTEDARGRLNAEPAS